MDVGMIGDQILHFFKVIFGNDNSKVYWVRYLIDSTHCAILDHANKFVSNTSLTRRRTAIVIGSRVKCVQDKNQTNNGYSTNIV